MSSSGLGGCQTLTFLLGCIYSKTDRICEFKWVEKLSNTDMIQPGVERASDSGAEGTSISVFLAL